MAMYILKCTECAESKNYVCSYEERDNQVCIDCGTSTLQYNFADNMTTSMIRSSLNSLHGKEKQERIEKDMNETFKVTEYSGETNIQREEAW